MQTEAIIKKLNAALHHLTNDTPNVLRAVRHLGELVGTLEAEKDTDDLIDGDAIGGGVVNNIPGLVSAIGGNGAESADQPEDKP
jgi:ABC-type transporter Mla subunit MlaD